MLKTITTCAAAACALCLSALTGFGISGPVTLDNVPPNLALIAPAAGASWHIDCLHEIMWSASDSHFPAAPIDLCYSINGGATFAPIAAGLANEGSETWLVPAPESSSARVRISASDSFGNHSEQLSGPFSVTYAPPEPPQGVTVDTSNGIDAVLTWLPVTETINGTPFTPDGYIVLYNETTTDLDEDWYFLGETAGLSYTHQRVALFRDQMFYRVIAYADPDLRLRVLISSLETAPEGSLSLADLKAAWGGER